MKKVYHGSCHCGQVKFECEIDLSEGIRKCNCTFCRKAGYQKAFAYKDDFRIIAGKDRLKTYRATPSNWPEGHIDHYFCENCGMQPFSRGYLEMDPFNGNFHAINVVCLDDATEEELAAAPIVYEDGLHDRQDRAPSFTAHL
jgi:hypothetical protein